MQHQSGRAQAQARDDAARVRRARNRSALVALIESLPPDKAVTLPIPVAVWPRGSRRRWTWRDTARVTAIAVFWLLVTLGLAVYVVLTAAAR